MAVAVLLLGMGWWFWPRVDQRFVGKWRAFTQDRRNSYGVYDFKASGIMSRTLTVDAEMVAPDVFQPVTSPPSWSQWRVEGTSMTIGKTSTGARLHVVESIFLKLCAWTGLDVLTKRGWTFEIERADMDEILLQSEDGERTLLKRIVE
ncbi:hypothetical protein AYO47_00145 [Planctomyces sp. SCGC AG-212-M04]|nr:hypothetical protein AYO47_00145 [Planctomyces sp. SCGC AG-212-M04]